MKKVTRALALTAAAGAVLTALAVAAVAPDSSARADSTWGGLAPTNPSPSPSPSQSPGEYAPMDSTWGG